VANAYHAERNPSKMIATNFFSMAVTEPCLTRINLMPSETGQPLEHDILKI
jgi:hypothetical protein